MCAAAATVIKYRFWGKRIHVITAVIPPMGGAGLDFFKKYNKSVLAYSFENLSAIR
jgi:hypothetical protein